MLLAPANGAEVGHLPVQASELEQALRHAHRLAQGQIEQALDRQAKLDRRLAVLRATVSLAAGTAVPAHVLVQPDEQGAARLQRRVVVFPVGHSVFRFCWGAHTVSLPRAHARPLHGSICATKPSQAEGKFSAEVEAHLRERLNEQFDGKTKCKHRYSDYCDGNFILVDTEEFSCAKGRLKCRQLARRQHQGRGKNFQNDMGSRMCGQYRPG